MRAKSPPHPVMPVRFAIWGVTLIIPPVLWCIGFLCSLSSGCSTPQALLKATVYALSALAGWTAYLLIRWPTETNRSDNFPFSPTLAMSLMNIPMLNPARDPLSFPQMLAHACLCSVVFMSLIGLGSRLLARAKIGGPAGPHPLSDPELDQPLSRG